MSATPIMTQSTGGADEIKRAVRRHIEDLERQLAKAREYLATLEGTADPRDLIVMEMMRGLELGGVGPPFRAIELFLKHVGKPQPRWVICRALILGGAKLGSHGAKSVNQAISTNVGLRKPKLEEPDYDSKRKKQNPDNLVGLPGMFGK